MYSKAGWYKVGAQSQGENANEVHEKHLPDHGQSRIRVETLHKVNPEAHACPQRGRGAPRNVHAQS
jgi:hypothetical protein